MMSSLYNKRRFLKISLLSSSFLFIGSNKKVFGGLFDFSSFGIYSKKPVPGIPSEWFNLIGEELYQYANYILSLGLKNISPRMVIAPHFKCRKKIKNCLPPKKLWRKIGPTLKVIDDLSNELGVPVKEILSVYRSPDYNRAVHGNVGSFHLKNKAVDVRFEKVNSWHVAKAARNLRDKKKAFKGGVGYYRGFVHIDTRGYNSDW